MNGRASPSGPADQVRLLAWALVIGLVSGGAALALRGAATWLPQEDLRRRAVERLRRRAARAAGPSAATR